MPINYLISATEEETGIPLSDNQKMQSYLSHNGAVITGGPQIDHHINTIMKILRAVKLKLQLLRQREELQSELPKPGYGFYHSPPARGYYLRGDMMRFGKNSRTPKL